MTRRAPGCRWLHPRPPKVRPRTKAAPRPRRTPRLAPALARARPPDPPLFLDADAPGGPAPCWRAILRTLVKKLLVAAPPRASERMRPGRGRKRSSSSRLIGAAPASQRKNTVKLAVVPLKVRRMLAFRQGAALRRLLNGAARRLPTSVQTTIFARDGPRWCHPL